MGANKRQYVRWIIKGEKERKRKKENEGKQAGEKERKPDKKERKGREKQKREIFSAFRRSKLDGSRRKVNPCIKSYAWVPKSWSFV